MPQKPPDRPHERLELKHPLVQGTDTIDALYIMRPRGKEMGLLPTSLSGAGAKLADLHPWMAMLAGITVRELELLELDDYIALQTKVGEYIEDFPQAGPRPSSSSDAMPTGGSPNSSS